MSRRKNPFAKNQTKLSIETLEGRALPSTTSCNTISGFVYYDANNNGLYDANETPIANSDIELRNDANVVVGTTKTDANGFYKFSVDSSKPGQDATLVKTVEFDETQTNFTLDKLLEQFDPSLGTLESIEIKHEGSITSDIKVENVSDISESDISATVSGTLTLTAPGVNDALNISGNAGQFHAESYDGNTDFGGDSGKSFGANTVNGSNTITLTGNAMQAYIGTGTVTVTESAVATSNATGGGNLDVRIRSTGKSKLTVTYHYKEAECLEPGDYKIVQFVQPPDYLDGKESKDGTVIPNTIGTDFINVTLDDTDLVNNNFGELKNITLSGHVWHDANDDGVRDATEAPIPNTIVKLEGPGGPFTTTTDADGYYEFTDLDPGTYTIKETQPAGYLDGKDNAGTKGGTVVNNAAEDQIKEITLVDGDVSENNDFGEVKPASIAGHVWYDLNNNGLLENGEPRIADATVTLTGFDSDGPVSKSMLTNAQGEYKFADLRPGTYALTETQPAGYDDGKDTIGTPGGITANDVFSAINLQAGVDGVDNNFGEIKPDVPGEPLPKDVGPFGQLPYISKVQAIARPTTDNIDPTLRGQMTFVVGTQVTLLGAQPDLNATMAGVVQLQNGTTTTQYVSQLWTSNAHRSLQVNSIYSDILGRAPTATELASGIQSLNTGDSELDLKETLYVSSEYQALHAGSTDLATALYQDILNVTPGTQSLTTMLQSMANDPLNDVVHNLLTSDDSIANMIDDSYRLALRRAATSSEITTWSAPIKAGTMTLDELTQRLLASSEFYLLAFNNVH
jgi:protocatechuate 3,4-dioxygenase beta subunit